MVYALSIFLPLFSALFVGLWGSRLGDKVSQWLSTVCLIVAALCGGIVFWEVAINGKPYILHVFDWINTPYLRVSWSLGFDSLSSVMVIVVTSVSAMVHLYSIGYMHHDSSIPRFMAYLSLFTFFMLMLVTSQNLLQLFFGWEGVGLASYLLIGFWYEKDSANAASMKAFIVNRVGDVSFAIGLLLIYMLTGSLDFSAIFSKLDIFQTTQWTAFGITASAATVIGLLLFGGAMGKSAQLGLHVWLPDAMEGPTPVSALIHAATMVTAGVFLLVRMSPLMELAPHALDVIAIVGAATAFFAGTVAITQNDIKRVIAYSTCSQLGYMFFAIGVSAYSAAIFHLFTHAFFKALLFLGAGSVIHALSDEQDLQKMGGIWRFIPVTYGLMWVGTLALTGFPFLSGYYSKDLILESAYLASSPLGQNVFWVGIVAAVLTATYSWRLMFLAFHGPANADERVMARVHESPPVMLAPLVVLAIGSLFAGMVSVQLFTHTPSFWQGILPDTIVHKLSIHVHFPLWVQGLPIVAGFLGFVLAYILYMWKRGMAASIARACKGLHRFLYHKWYFDELYTIVFVRPVWHLGLLFWRKGDQGLVDPLLPDGIANVVAVASQKLSRFQTGYVFQYAVIMLLGVIGLTAWQVISRIVVLYG